MDLSTDEVIVAEGRWQTQEKNALVNGLPLGPSAVNVFVDKVLMRETFVWRPTMEMMYLEDCLMAFVSWPVHKVVFENLPSASGNQKLSLQHSGLASKSSAGAKSTAACSKSAAFKSTSSKSSASGSETPLENANGSSSPIQKTLQKSQCFNQGISKKNMKCKLMDITGKKRVMAERRWATNDPKQKVHFVPLDDNAVKVWVDIVKVSDVTVWRPSDEVEIMEDALGTAIAWPEDKVIMS